jgi:hypothetical protein
MSRNPRIEEILEAWWQGSHGEFASQVGAFRRRDELVRLQLARSGARETPDDLLNALYGHYREYCVQQNRARRTAPPARA